MPVSGVGRGGESIPPKNYQVALQKKSSFALFHSYDLTVTVGNKTVTIKMNTFKTPWTHKIIGKNLFKKICSEFNLKEPGEVNSLMRAFVNSAFDIEKQIATGSPEIKKLRQEASVSVAAMKLFFTQYPASYQLEVQLSEFDSIFSPKDQPVAIVKKNMALLYHELMQENPNEEMIKSLADKINGNIEDIKGDDKSKNELIKSFNYIKSAILEREKCIINMQKSIPQLSTKGVDDAEYQEMLKSIDTAEDLSPYLNVLDNPEKYNVNQFIGLVHVLNEKTKSIVSDYQENHKEIIEAKTLAYYIADVDQQKKAEKFALERDLKKDEAKERYNEKYGEIMELQSNGYINQKPISEVNEEINDLYEVLSPLDDQMRALNQELDALVKVEDNRASFKEIFFGLLDDKKAGDELRELIKDVGSLVSYPFQSAWVKISQLKAKNNPNCAPLIAKFKIIHQQYLELSRKKNELVEKRDTFYSTINEMKDRIEVEWHQEERKADEEYERAIDQSMKDFRKEYQTSTKHLTLKEQQLKSKYDQLKPLSEKVEPLSKKCDEYQNNLTLLHQQTRKIEHELGIDSSFLPDYEKDQSLVALQLTMLSAMAALGIEESVA